MIDKESDCEGIIETENKTITTKSNITPKNVDVKIVKNKEKWNVHHL